jgi:hypothetical protein
MGAADMTNVVAPVSDAVLWGRIAEGDTGAFGDLYERHARAVYNFCFRKTANWAHACDPRGRG